MPDLTLPSLKFIRRDKMENTWVFDNIPSPVKICDKPLKSVPVGIFIVLLWNVPGKTGL